VPKSRSNAICPKSKYIGKNPLGGNRGQSEISIRRAIGSHEQRIAEHEAKLEAYIRDPDAYDNQGFLRNAPSEEIRQRIIEGRIRHLQYEIDTHYAEIERLRALLGE
jgi:hypothetical protein